MAIGRSVRAGVEWGRQVAERVRASRATPRPSRTFRYPDDVADPDALKAMLRETNLFGEATAEAEGYLNDAIERFRVTMSLVPPLDRDAKVLELGANPYFLTRLLRRRGLDVTAANWFGDVSGFGAVGRQEVVESGEPTVYEFDHFNIETARFPYDDGSFDLVLFCEILEHLPADPIHTLAEIHRVLKPRGTLLLTTPNATRLDNLQRMMRGDNVYEQLSGYGTYGRHNREYTVAELRQLLTECGYNVVDVFAADIGHPPAPAPADRLASVDDRGENLFALAEAGDGPRWPYPDWLYSSQHALRRIVLPSLIMGRNCTLQATGFHVLETLHGRAGRWMGAGPAVATLDADGAQHRLVVEGTAPPPAAGDKIELTAVVAGTTLHWTIPCDDGPFVVEGEVDVPAGANDVTLTATPAWRPVDVGLGGDTRHLGVVVHAVHLDDASFG